MGKIYTLIIVVMMTFVTSCAKDSGIDSGSFSEGKGGSMARFCIAGDFLFTVDQNNLNTFEISDPKDPVLYKGRTQDLGFGIETIFPMDSLLFIGTQIGMYIYRITNRGFTQYLSHTEHIRSCDPVVAQGDYAYITLNSNNVGCGRISNVLQIYDITDLQHPIFIREIPGFTSPMGLGIDGDKLFVCDNGLKVYDITNRTLPEQIDDLHSAGLHDVEGAYDVITNDGFLILVAASGIYQLDYTGETLRLLSKIDVKLKK
ncbi:MAG: hypothetical protein LBS55_02360 [Prevotellaceae bacterium]|jgi:hypothetical protein|nr:hypothetical protein [Prevotellaceae bacterium]